MDKSSFFPYVTPNHFSADDFTEIQGFTLDQEFNLIAPAMGYFECDCSRKEQARKALTQLKRRGHPLMHDRTVSEVMKETSTPDGLHSRYNGLIMAIGEEEIQGIESYIDAYGAFSFRIDDDASVLMGDAYGLFALYDNAAAVRERLREAQAESV